MPRRSYQSRYCIESNIPETLGLFVYHVRGSEYVMCIHTYLRLYEVVFKLHLQAPDFEKVGHNVFLSFQ